MGRLKTREDSFEQAFNFFLMHFKIVLEYCTGYGKTYQALRLIIDSIKKDGERWAIIVPTEILINNWYEEIEKWGMSKYRDKIDIVCYASIHKLKNVKHFCLDEAHNITPLRIEKLDDLIDRKESKLIGLSATIDVEKFSLLKHLGFLKVHRHKITLDEGVDAEIVTDYRIIGLPVVPNEAWLKTNRGIEKWISVAKRKGVKQVIEAAIFKRMRHVYDSAQKLELAKYVCDNLTKGDKILIYVANIGQAKLLSEHTGFPAYHSQLSKKNRKQILDEFNAKPEGGLISCYTLNEGANITGVNKALVVQTRSNDREAIQRLGRILRWLGKSAGQAGVCYIMYLVGTQDEKWARKSIKSFDKKKLSGRIVDPKNYHTNIGTIEKQEQ